MYHNLFRITLLSIAIAIILAACGAPVPTLAPATADEAPTAVATLPFAHTACAEGADLSGQTIPFYHILNPNDQADTVYDPLRAGYADAAEYFNAHGGICGGILEQVFNETHWGDALTIYSLFSALDPKPVVVTLYGSGDAVRLADQLAEDEIPALNIRGGSTASAYGEDGKTPGWVFATNPLYVDQVGAMCDYIIANPARFPDPVMGFINFDDDWARGATEESRAYCDSLGIGYAGASYFAGHGGTGAGTYIVPHVQNLIDAGANILYANSHEGGPAVIARTLTEMGLQDKITLAAVNRAMDPYVAFSGESDLGADGLPMISGMIGSLPVRSWAETDNPGIQLITEQADLHERPLTMRTDGYIMGWDTTDLLIEVYIQTGNRVGFDHITGAEIKETLENIVYAPLGDVQRIDYQGGARRALAENRIGEMNFLGQDGKTPAGAGNPPMVVKVGDQEHLVPMVIPLTDYQPAPDLRPGGADVSTVASSTSITTVEAAATQVTSLFAGRIVFETTRAGGGENGKEIYAINGDGGDAIRLTDNQFYDGEPSWSPDGMQIVFASNRDHDIEVYSMNADGSGQTRLTDSLGADELPLWSPDGKKIVFLTERDGNAEIYVMNADGTNPIRLTNNQAWDSTPTWSPDGTKIAFASERDGNNEIYVMKADGSGQTRLTNNPALDIFPNWAPDGTQIVFISDRDANHEIYVMDADGNNPKRLTDNPADDGKPGWSPDGSQIVFDSDRDGNWEIYMMNTDGSNLGRLTDNAADDYWASWSQ